MKRFFLLLFFSGLLFSCKKEISENRSQSVKISSRVSYVQNSENLVLTSGTFKNIIPNNKLPFHKAMLLNSSFVGFFSELNLEKKLIGVSSPEYIFSDKIHQFIDENKIQNIGNEQKYNLEKILAYKPDVIFTNYVPNFGNTYDVLKKNGIEVIFLDEFLEQTPLDKSRYLLLFGKLFGVENLANHRFSEIEKNYNRIKNWTTNSPKKPLVLCNEMYGNQWFLPGGKSFVTTLINDAGGDYILKDNPASTSIPLSFEEVFVKSEHAEYWINISPHNNKKELLNMNPNYNKMKVFNFGKLFMINNKENGTSNDYFESGVVRSDLVLRDYFKIFHPNDDRVKNVPLIYIKELK